ncbi:hypothetical protein RJT34_13068 [Clitoria ternatea]|uniref:Uncharacterized protein n=1 Tax=Clitoria ternatea TaxID=43366 RepID=A0AAN9JPX8_CLITE
MSCFAATVVVLHCCHIAASPIVISHLHHWSKVFYDSSPSVLRNCCNSGSLVNFQVGETELGKWRNLRVDNDPLRRSRQSKLYLTAKEMSKDNTLWKGSGDESDEEMGSKSHLDKEIRKVRQQAKKYSDLIDADDSDEKKTLWTGDEMDNDDDIPIKSYPNESSDKYIDKLFEIDEMPKYRTISEILKAEQEHEELSLGKQARKIVVENALNKLKKGPDRRYTNVWEVMSDLDILIRAFENVVPGPEYAELRQGRSK